MKTFKYRIGIIGLGHMGKAIFDGLVESGDFAREGIVTSNTAEGNREVAQSAEVILLAVKPDVVMSVLDDVRDALSADQLVISVAAGLKIADMQGALGDLGADMPLVRVMPNICASVLESMSCWVKSPEVREDQVAMICQILRAIGDEAEVESEDMIDYVTAIAGSGPAYFFRIAELLTEFGVAAGFAPEVAEKLAGQTFFGSAKMLHESGKSAATLRSEVTSKGGTTEAALKSMAENDFGETFKNGVMAAYKRAAGK